MICSGLTAGPQPRCGAFRRRWRRCRSDGFWPSAPGGGSTDFDRTVTDLLRDGAAETSLERLDPAAVADVAADVLGAPDAGVLTLAEGVHGNPFWLIELFSGLRDEHLVAIDAAHASWPASRFPAGSATRCDGGWMHVASSQNVAAVAASWAAASHASSPRSSTCLPRPCSIQSTQLLASELFTECGAPLSFSHDLNREAVRASQPSSAAHALDRQVAAALLAAGALPVEVATQLACSPRQATRSPSRR